MTNENSSDWFETWFDTSYYHTLYKHRDFKEAENFITNLLNYLNLPEGSKCLDLACGKGRHSLFLSKKKLNVVGVDLSQNSIKIAKEYQNENVEFDVHDMRKPYNKSGKFDAVFNLFTSFGYFDSNTENLKVLKSIHEMLRDQGVLVVDFMNAKKTIDNLVESEEKEIDGISFIIKRSFDGSHIHKNIQFIDKNNSFNFNERVQALFRSDFEFLLNESGFKIVDVFGDFDLNPFNKVTSNRLILIAQKA